MERTVNRALINEFLEMYERSIYSNFVERSKPMKKATKLRLFGGAILLFNLTLIGRYNLSGAPVLLLTLGFAVCFEYLIVGRYTKNDQDTK